MTEKDIIIIGGGAAGFFAAINAAEINPKKTILLLERGKDVLTKVKISGGGRCNITNAEFLPGEFVKNYPRGERELRGPMHTFMSGDIIGWFEDRGISLKTEEDGRIFPESNTSQTIVDFFINRAESLGIEVRRKEAVQDLSRNGNAWEIKTSLGSFTAEKVMVATGSNPKIWGILKKLGHTIVPGVPSLFTFRIEDERIKDLPGISTEAVVKFGNLQTRGPLLITHWGMSGPAILKLSAWGARELSSIKEFEIEVNWIGNMNSREVLEELKALKKEYAKQQVMKKSFFDLPKRLWQNLVKASHIAGEMRWADLNKDQLSALSSQMTSGVFQVSGKSTFKEEFVTAGGVELREVNFKTFESRITPNLFLAGEVLNIDAITGGFNFQNAWTGAFIAAKTLSEG
ncbi:MAG TPA: NAD(P)/FAD-dependent oxidoreductase [Salinimicrobium sp.]|nr:NAD(P)/FAD-dependent oxidoreductase [Salinimicrobium sp.]